MTESNSHALCKRFIYLIEIIDSNGIKSTVFDKEGMIFFDILDAECMCKKWKLEFPHLSYQPVLYFRSENC